VTAVRRLLAAAGLPSAAAAGMRAEHVEAMAALALADYCLSVDAHAWNAADVRAAYAAAITGGGCTPETPSR
jgi:alcohol dehydrogenase class IV